MTTNSYKEIGGYFELSLSNCGHSFSGIALNSARNALRYIIKAYDVKKVFIPYYTCPVVWEALDLENVKYCFYNIDLQLNANIEKYDDNIFLLANNYFGVCGKKIQKISRKFKNLLVDDAQSLFTSKMGLAQFSSPRKFFSVPDGGFAVCNKILKDDFPRDSSWERCSHLLIRADHDAKTGYSHFQQNEANLAKAPIAYMSHLTEKLLCNFDYEGAKLRRLENFSILHDSLKHINELILDLHESDVPMVYPLFLRRENLRKKLINNSIYVATYWPNIEKFCPQNSHELELQKYLLPIPLDQRYGKDDMERILEIIHGKN